MEAEHGGGPAQGGRYGPPRWTGFPWRYRSPGRYGPPSRYGPLSRYRPPWWNHPDDPEARRARLPWRSTLVVTAFVLGGTAFAAQEQQRVPLDGWGHALLLLASLPLLWRVRYPAAVALGTAAVTLAYLALGYPYGPVLLAVAELARVRREQWFRERADRAAAAKRRADEERLRIVREVHDVLAHGISVINAQAGMGLALHDSDPGTGSPNWWNRRRRPA